MDKEIDVLGKYRSVSNKLKKRFLKRPNVAEGSEQYGALARTLAQQECPQYAAFCHLAQARCEHSLANPAGESEALVKAAREFIKAETETVGLKCPSFQEHLTAAINCYCHAIRVHIENKNNALAVSLCLELGNALQKLDKPGEAIVHFQRAAELQSQSPLDCLVALGHLATCKIKTSSSVTGKPVGAYCDILARCEVTRVLLLMLLQPTPQRIRPEHAQMLEKYAWDPSEDYNTAYFLDDDLFLMLQSVVMACQSNDVEALQTIQVDLWPELSAEQNEVLYQVIRELSHPSGEGL